jgi:hypothetical protein
MAGKTQEGCVASVRLKLLEEHGREAEKQGAEFYNFG